jgi:hypothetical protein
MRHCLGVLLASVILLGPAASGSAAATIQDLVKLKAAGLGDDILIALIESDGSVFNLKADDVIALRKQGLSEKVIIVMLATAKKAAPPAPAGRPSSATAAEVRQAPTPPSIQIDDPYASENTTQVTVPSVPAPVVINITQKVEQRTEAPADYQSQPVYTTYPYYPYYYVGAPIVRPFVPVAAPQPVYWGFGGQRRPGTWKDK